MWDLACQSNRVKQDTTLAQVTDLPRTAGRGKARKGLIDVLV